MPRILTTYVVDLGDDGLAQRLADFVHDANAGVVAGTDQPGKVEFGQHVYDFLLTQLPGAPFRVALWVFGGSTLWVGNERNFKVWNGSVQR